MNILRLPDINISQVIYTAKIAGKIDINKTGLKRVHWSGGYIRINKRKLHIHVSRNIVFCIDRQRVRTHEMSSHLPSSWHMIPRVAPQLANWHIYSCMFMTQQISSR